MQPRGRDHYVFGETIRFDSPVGPFELDDDGWYVCIHSENHQGVIHYLDRMLHSSGLFRRDKAA